MTPARHKASRSTLCSLKLVFTVTERFHQFCNERNFNLRLAYAHQDAEAPEQLPPDAVQELVERDSVAASSPISRFSVFQLRLSKLTLFASENRPKEVFQQISAISEPGSVDNDDRGYHEAPIS